MIKPLAIIDEASGRNLLSVSWDTSSLCNYRCSYCDSGYHDGQFTFPKLENILRFLSDLSAYSGKRLYLEIKGGEPTYWKLLPEFLTVCWEKGWGSSVVTNGSQKLNWWEENLIKISDVNFSLHPESYEKFAVLEKLKYINERRLLTAKYMMLPSLFDKCVSDIEFFRQEIPGLNLKAYFLSRPKSDNELYSYTSEQVEKVMEINAYEHVRHKKIWPGFEFEDRSHAWMLGEQGELVKVDAQELKIRGVNQWSNWLCHAGIDRIHISIEGNIYRGQCAQGGLLGNIHTGQWTIPKDPVRCGKQRCFCGSEILLKKWRPEEISLLKNAFI